MGDERDPLCVQVWPECRSFGYDPRCCRFPKSCSAGSMTADQSSPVAAGDAGGGDVEAVDALSIVIRRGGYNVRGQDESRHEAMARAILASPWLADLLQAARAEGAREALEEAAVDHHERAQNHVNATDASRAYRDAWLSASRDLRARAASVGRGGVEGDESAFEGAVADAQAGAGSRVHRDAERPPEWQGCNSEGEA